MFKRQSIIMIIFLLLLSGCGLGKEKLVINERVATIKQLVTIEDSRFTMQIPEGWVYETVGEFQNFGLRAYDPDNPHRSIFYYGTMSPWLKSEQAKSFWTWYAQSGYPQAQMYADSPVLYDISVEGLYYSFNIFTYFAQAYGINHNFYQFNDFDVVEQFSTSTAMAPYALDESTLRLNMKDNNGYPIEALVTATIVDAMSYPANGIDAGYYTAYRVSGIIAPADDMIYHEELLTQALGSFSYKQEYIDQGVELIEWGTEQAIQMQQTLNETSQIIHDSWAYRNKVVDSANAEFISYIRGKGYLQDPNSGEIFEADQSFVDDYLKDPNQYNRTDLVPLEAGAPGYGQPVTGVIGN